MVTLYTKKEGQKRFTKIKRFRKYKDAWNYVAEKLIELDYRLYLSSGLDYLHYGYTKRRIFPFASHEIAHKGVVFKIVI
jgi:hypothetical protein